MGLDLRLLPVDFHAGTWGFSHTVLDCERDYELFDALRGVDVIPVPAKFSTFSGRSAEGDPCYGDTQETPYGEPLRCAIVYDLLVRWPNTETQGVRNRAIRVYLAALPKTTQIALYWH
jgi:hypothetical protein